MSKILIDIAIDFWAVVAEMAPYLLFGFLMAGLLSVLVSRQLVERHLGGSGLWPVLKAAAFGVPLPLCSCGVIPVSASLRRHGASKAATTAFLMATPQDGIDSIMVTLSLLGPVFAVFRPVAALVSGVAGGALVAALDKDENADRAHGSDCQEPCCADDGRGKFRKAMAYGFITLPGDIGRALLAGLVVAALISALVPKDYFANLLGQGWGQMILMMLVGIPIYVCATASVPIAWALIATGISPGAALVFLMTGPATNAATLVTVWKVMGKRTAAIYLLTVAAGALAAGAILDSIPGVSTSVSSGALWMLPHWLKTASALVLLGLLGYAVIGHMAAKKRISAVRAPNMIRLRIGGMTCSHCERAVRQALLACSGVTAAEVDHRSGLASVAGEGLVIEDLRRAVRQAGYEAHPDSDADPSAEAEHEP